MNTPLAKKTIFLQAVEPKQQFGSFFLIFLKFVIFGVRMTRHFRPNNVKYKKEHKTKKVYELYDIITPTVV